MAKKPNTHNIDNLDVYDRQGNNLTKEQAEEIVKKCKGTSDALTSVFFSPHTSVSTVEDLLNSIEEYNKAMAHAKDRDLAVAARKEADDAIDSYVKGLFENDPSITEEWMEKASPAAKLQKAKDIIAASLKAAGIGTGAAKGNTSAKTTIPATTQKRIDKLVADLEAVQTKLNQAESLKTELESKVRLAEQARDLAVERCKKLENATPPTVVGPDNSAIATAREEGKAEAKAEAKAEIDKAQANAATQIAQAQADADKRVANAIKEAQEAAEKAIAEATNEALVAKQQLKAFTDAKAKAVTWPNGDKYRCAVFSLDNGLAVPDEIVRALKLYFPSKVKELVGRSACAEFDGGLTRARVKADPDKFIEEDLPL